MADDKEIQQWKRRLSELAERSYSQNIYTFTNFLGLSSLQAFYEIRKELEYAGCDLNGGAPMCERQMIRFGSAETLGYEAEYPIVCLRIEPLLLKFAENLTHRDFLGAVMNLGIEREMVGDILVEEKAAYVFCVESIAPYIVDNLDQVRHTHVKCHITEVPDELASPKMEDVSVSVSSPRIDGVISKLYNIPRSTSLELFRAGRVFVNGRMTENNSYSLRQGDTVTARGFGRFCYEGEQGETRKGKLRVLAKIYR